MRRTTFACLLGCLALPAPVLAGDGPICGSTVVLDAVTSLLSQAGSDARVDGRSVAQVPTARLDTVLCAVRLRDEYYDTSRFGPVPILRPEVFQYTVRRARTALLVTPYRG
ncbi:MAG: hypothetical protein ACRYGM_17120 [Janthinobacterium lividum]